MMKAVIKPNASVTPRLYGFPKIHKATCPLRPIVDTINSTVYLIAKHLAGLLNPHLGKTEAYVKNSTSLVQTLDSFILLPKDRLVRDIISLFTNVAIEPTLKLLEPLFPAQL